MAKSLLSHLAVIAVFGLWILGLLAIGYVKTHLAQDEACKQRVYVIEKG